MQFGIQLISGRQRAARIYCMPCPEKDPSFDSVYIEYDFKGAPSSHVYFLVPVGRGEALAEALRKAVEP